MISIGKFEAKLIAAISFLISVLVLVCQATHTISESQVLPIFLSMVLTYAFLKKPLGSHFLLQLLNWIVIAASIAVGVYLAVNFAEIASRAGTPTSTDIYMGLLAIVVILEALRRTVGWGLTLICIFFLIYAYYGRYFPDLLKHKGYSIERISSQLYLGSSGLYGLPLATMFRYVVIFIIFGAILERTGVSNFMIDLSRAVAGRLPGGTGHVSVLSSGLMGSVSGSAVANVMVGGNVTIPAMKKSGFSGTMAGAIEAVSSNGGQILPPVMGAAAFLIAENLQIPYAQVALAALLPGTLYFLAIAAVVHFYAVKHGIRPVAKSDLPSFGQVLKSGWLYPMPFIALIAMLLAGYSPTYSGLGATVAAIICGFLNSKNRLTLRKLFAAIREAGEGVVMLSIASAGAGIVIGSLTITGLGNRFSSVLVDLSGDSLLMLLLLSMIGSLIMGMGMSTTVVYILLASLVAPALIDMGITPIAAHLFILYFGTISMLTPPVAMASYAAAAISGDSPEKTGWTGFKIAIPSYILPFAFVYNQALLMEGSAFSIASSAILALVGVVLFSAAMIGWLTFRLSMLDRMYLILCAGLLLTGQLIPAAASILLLGLGYFLWWKKKMSRLELRSERMEL
ncbi:TRAP transporter permease [Brevibacillus fulvus]|uniref:TRAP transporter 4TM/12TM fusion protein n=1 Tax=Brevibacillus fulvus TaxID=1125967 RepID=A0A938Y061_9BACL|nr:TRAP transporter fused permease subunit [Brevibacillus fulvus]MBM7589122.1 TRAP transporter 4TM/12TM fusion protein [Brevibacillus fulvus]